LELLLCIIRRQSFFFLREQLETANLNKMGRHFSNCCSFNLLPALLFLISVTLLLAPREIDGYVFECVDKCQCDTDDSAIHCHNKPEREQLQLPEKPLRGFSVLGITNNNLKALPSEDTLLEIFPDLKAVDVECNPNFDCSSLSEFKTLQIISQCNKTGGKDETICEPLPATVPPPTEDCDASCQMKRYYARLHNYILKLWHALLKKLAKVRDQNPWMKDVEKWLRDAAKTVEEAANDATKEDGWFTSAGDWLSGAYDSVKNFFNHEFGHD
jgi:hypothetical protein